MTEHYSAFIRRLKNGWLVRLGLSEEQYFTDLKSALNHAGAGLAGPGEYHIQSLEMAPGQELEELVADDIVRKAWTISMCDPAYGGAADRLAEAMVGQICGDAASLAIGTRLTDLVREKLAVKRLLEAKSGDKRPRKRREGRATGEGSTND